MKATTRKFISWLMSLTVILRCFVIALLVHVGLLFILATVKVGGMAASAIRAAFDPPASTGGKEEEPDPFAAYRDQDYKAPGVGGPLAPVEYKVAIADTKPTESSVAEVIGVVDDSATAVARLQGAPGAMSAPAFGGGGEGKIGIAGIAGGSGHFKGRIGPARTINAAKFKASQEAERAVLAALRWLKENQASDGTWTASGDKCAGTALGVLAFLGHGHTPDDKEFGECVNRGVTFLVNSIDGNGLLPQKGHYMYAQGAVTLALAEAYGMTGSKAIREPLERAVKAAVAAQKVQKSEKHQGGWRYSAVATDSDTSVSGWMIMSLKSARLAGLEVPSECFEDASKFLWNVCSDEGGFGYNGPGRSPNMTGVGVLCQQFLGHQADPRIKKSLDYLKTQKFDWNAEGRFSLYGWYYITQAMFQGGGAYWEYWNKQFRDALIKVQSQDGHWQIPPSGTEEKQYAGDTHVYATTLCCLMLEVYYRYLPIYQELEKGALRPPAAGTTATK